LVHKLRISFDRTTESQLERFVRWTDDFIRDEDHLIKLTIKNLSNATFPGGVLSARAAHQLTRLISNFGEVATIPVLKPDEETEVKNIHWNPDYEGPVLLRVTVRAEDKQPVEYSDEMYVFGTEDWRALLTVISRESLLIIEELTELKELVANRK
jgi:hypothetical protein